MELELSDFIHSEKYRGANESFREWANRVAQALKDDEEHFKPLRDLLYAQRFLPGGRIQAAAGSPRQVTAFNCYVSATIEDSFVDGKNSIMNVAGQAAQTMRMGGGIGYDFSTLRPKGELIKTLDSQSSGPLGFMPVYNAVCDATASAGNRRGAQMAVLRVDHPDIEAFVRAKQNGTDLTGFNTSVAVTDEFMNCVLHDKPFSLRWNGRTYGEISAKALWEEIMRSTWDWAEPGVLFIDTINRYNNLRYCETIAATNPCGEQPLPPHGACLLGSFNLVHYIDNDDWDWTQLASDVSIAYRAMDNVIDRTIYPLYEQEVEAKNKRRMGIGVTGLANAIETIGHQYGTTDFLKKQQEVMSFITECLYQESARRAETHGAFPLYKEDFLDSPFIKRLSKDTQELISKNGIRNSHLTSVAPTGTISLCADNVSSGVEPVYSLETERRVLWQDGPHVYTLQDYAYRKHGVKGKTAAECTADDHLSVLAMAQYYTDSAVSKTINVSPDMPWKEFKDIYFKAWNSGCKGCTTFNPGGKRMGIFAAPTKEENEGAACYIDPETGTRSCDE